MNSDYHNSPTFTSQSWIVDNIKSLISSNQEDDINNSHNNSDSSLNNNDVTLTDEKFIANNNNNNNNNNKLDEAKKTIKSSEICFDINHDISCDVEVEKSRTYADYEDSAVDRQPKRPFSPEEITENTNNLNINNLLQNLNQYHNLNNFDFDNLIEFGGSGINPNNLLHSPNSQHNLQFNDFNELFYQPQQIDNSSTSIKKKKLTRTSTTSMLLPLPTFSITQSNDQPDSNLSILDNINRNLINQLTTQNFNDDSNYHSNPQSPNSSYIIHHHNHSQNHYNNNNGHYLSAHSNKQANSIRRSSLNSITNQFNQIDTNTSTPFNGENNTNNPMNPNSSYCFYDPADPDNFYSYDSYSNNNSIHNYINESFRNNNSNNMFKSYKKDDENLNDSINVLNNKNTFNSDSANYNKRITKSSSSLFNNNISSNTNMNKSDFIHSSSFDNIGLLNVSNSNKPMTSTCSNYEISTHNLVPFFPPEKNNSCLDFNNKWSTTPNYNPNNKFSQNNGSCKIQYNSNNSSTNQTRQGSAIPSTSGPTSSSFLHDSINNKDQIVLHVRNLDYKISSDEWKRILLENFRKHCKENISVNVVTNPDKSLLGVVKLASKDDARLAISCLHHKKIGYKRLNVNIAYSSNTNSPKSKIVALLKASESNEMALTRFIELYEQRYNQSITLSELFKLKEIVHISHSKDGQGRQIKLISKNYQHNLENEMQELLHTPFCSLHSHQRLDANNKKDATFSPNGAGSIGWLPNVIVSLRTFKSAVHKLLNDHGGQMPLLSFMDCYKCCIFNDSSNSSNNSNKSNKNSENKKEKSHDISSYQLVIDSENGVSLEHLITCAQDVQIQLNEGYYKQLQWENDKSKPFNSRGIIKNQSSNNLAAQACITPTTRLLSSSDEFFNDFDENLEDSQRKINQFSHEIVELLKVVPRCIIPLSKFNNEYHKKYGKQCRVADYGYTKLIELLESIPHILQILDSEFEKKLTLTHRVQVRRFSNDLIKVLKAHSTKQMFADEYPVSYEKHFSKQFDIRDYGVCYLEDMLAELPESIICRKEIEGRTFIQIPKIIQLEDERICTFRLSFDIIDMLKHKPRFSVQFNKFIPNYHHHFGRQCKLSNYGFTKLIELLEAMPETVQVVVRDGLQFVQLKKEIMLDLITQNLVKIIEESSNLKMNISLSKLEEIYNAKFQSLSYEDFDCDNFSQFYSLLQFEKYGLRTVLTSSLPNEIEYIHYYNNLNQMNSDKRSENFVNVNENLEWVIQLEKMNEKEIKKFCRLILKKLFDGLDELVVKTISELKNLNRNFYFKDFLDLILSSSIDLATSYAKSLNKRSFCFMIKLLSDFFVTNQNDRQTNIDIIICSFSDIYFFAKKIRNLYKTSNLLDMTINDLELIYKQFYDQFPANNSGINHDKIEKDGSGNIFSVFPYKRLGFVDVNLLFSQGLNMLVTIKKYNDKSICLNKEFWPASLIDSANTTSLSDSFNSPSNISPGTKQNPLSSLNNQTNGTPLLQRLSSLSSTSRRAINLNE